MFVILFNTWLRLQ